MEPVLETLMQKACQRGDAAGARAAENAAAQDHLYLLPGRHVGFHLIQQGVHLVWLTSGPEAIQ